MISRNGVPAATQRDEGARVRDDRQLRDIQELIAKLELVNRQLSFPVRKKRARRTAGSTTGTTAGTSAPGDTHTQEPATPDSD
jgi:hypothetical protein